MRERINKKNNIGTVEKNKKKKKKKEEGKTRLSNKSF